jgi:hypothetical protein
MFDVVARGDTVYLAVIRSSGLFLRRLSLAAASPSWVDVPGPSDPSLNVNPTCQANRPELFATEDGLYVTWDETCATNDWQVHLRRLY